MFTLLQNEFFNAIKEVLEVANNEFKPSKPTTKKKKIPPPKVPTTLDQQKSFELYQLLRPLGDVTDKLQSGSTTSNLVILAIVTAFRRKLILTFSY